MYDTVCPPAQPPGPGTNYDDVVLSNYDVIGEDESLRLRSELKGSGYGKPPAPPPPATPEVLEYSTVAPGPGVGSGGRVKQMEYSLLSHHHTESTSAPTMESHLMMYGHMYNIYWGLHCVCLFFFQQGEQLHQHEQRKTVT